MPYNKRVFLDRSLNPSVQTHLLTQLLGMALPHEPHDLLFRDSLKEKPMAVEIPCDIVPRCPIDGKAGCLPILFLLVILAYVSDKLA